MKKKNIFHIALFVAFVALLSLPWIQMKTQFVKIEPLKGAFNIAEKKPLTWQSYRDGSFQKSVEDYLSDHFGFREWAIKTYNQYIWSCYGLWNKTCIRLGQDHWLYFLDDVNDFNYGIGCYDAPDSASLMTRYVNDSRNLYWMQEILKEYGVSLFVCMAPSKSMIFPEHIADHVPGYQCGLPKAYPYYVSRFKELGLNHIDFNAYYSQLKGKTDYPLYYKFSSHWTNISVCYMGDTLLRYMEGLDGRRLPRLHVGQPYEAPAVEPDNDMMGVVSVWFPLEKQTYLYADVSMVLNPRDDRPRLLAVGDSYCMNFHNMVPFDSIFSQYRYWYYFHDIERDPNRQYVEQVDILDEVLNIDYLMVIWCPINIYKLGHGFPEQALINLCVDDSIVAARFRQEVAAIQSNPAQMQAVQDKADQNGWRLKQALTNEVYQRFYDHPDQYFEELNTNAVPTSRNSRIAETRDTLNRRGVIRRQIQNDTRWSQYVKRKAEESLISHQEAFDNEVDWVLQHPRMSQRDKDIKQCVIEIYTYEPGLSEVGSKAEAQHLTLDQAVWAEARKQSKK
ncbi:MAG: hypothetical protein KBT28_03595 [Bacteroidales bacterium]|nr:hypothetical protein [Candidatus Colimorpha merdihippi]